MRGRGLGAALGLALVATLAAINPGLLIAIPLALLVIALAPARSPYRLIGLVLLALLFTTPASGALWYAERGWALVLGAVFLAVVALRPGRSFVGRGITAVALASLIGGAILLLTGAWGRVEGAIARRVREGFAAWTLLLERSDDPAFADAGETMRRIAELEVMLYPALLALGSLAALAVAWWGYRRLAEPEAAGLAPMREFRFADHLVWVLIAGALLLVAPAGEVAQRAGANLAAFMAALYVLRGAAIVVALTGVGGVGTFLLGVVAVLLLPLVASAALVIGLSDTWLDLRRRAASDDPGSS